jgi:peptide deformylase
MEKALREAKDPQGVGLAAPQVGVSLRIFMIRPKKNGPITTLVNPEITNFSQRTIDPHSKEGVYEGCLSIPNHYAPVTRSLSVTVKYQSIQRSQDSKSKDQLNPEYWTLSPKEDTFSGFAAHVVQHEMDHLNGILFIDRVLEQNSKLYRLEGKEWEEISL